MTGSHCCANQAVKSKEAASTASSVSAASASAQAQASAQSVAAGAVLAGGMSPNFRGSGGILLTLCSSPRGGGHSR
jgi:hypothetical protein